MIDRVGPPSDFPLAEPPRLRPIEVFPIEERGRRGLYLRDTSDAGLSPMLVYDAGVDIVALVAEGRRTISELTNALRLRGSSITQNQVRSFLVRLDEAGFLHGPRAAHRFAERQAAFQAQPRRPAVHAGGAYPEGAAELPRMLAAGYVHPDGPGAAPKPRSTSEPAPPRAVIAPHVDLHRGAPTYSWAYKALAEAEPADLYVVLGTCHTPVRGHFAATRKAYDTPLGPVSTDASFLDRLGDRFGRDLYEGEFSHAGEHSIEFQAVYLRSLGLGGEGSAPMVPVLCDSLHSMVPFGTLPSDVSLVADFISALRATLAEDDRRITLVAAVDLAHIGPRFGDSWRVDRTRQASIEQADREMLGLVLTARADDYYEQVMRDRDARRICGLTPIYLLTALMQGEQRQGELLRYTQWVDTDESSSVTFASAVFR